jgi:hypothetical protein
LVLQLGARCDIIISVKGSGADEVPTLDRWAKNLPLKKKSKLFKKVVDKGSNL